MADDVDPTQSLPTEAEVIGDSAGSPSSVGFNAQSTTRTFEPVEIAMVEIEIVEFEAMERQPDADADGDVGAVADTDGDGDGDADVGVVADGDGDGDADVGVVADADTAIVGYEADEQEADEHEADKAVVEFTTLDVVISEESAAGEALLDEPEEALPSMADLDRVASELDDIDARLASLDEQRP